MKSGSGRNGAGGRRRCHLLGKSISIIYRRAQTFIGNELRPLGIGSGTYSALLELSKEDGQSQEMLAESIGVDKAAMKRAIDDLVARGFVERSTNESDRRAYRITLTRKGMETIPTIFAVARKWEKRITLGLEKDDKAALSVLLEKLAANSLNNSESENA